MTHQQANALLLLATGILVEAAWGVTLLILILRKIREGARR